MDPRSLSHSSATSCILPVGETSKRNERRSQFASLSWIVLAVVITALHAGPQAYAASRSTFIPVESNWYGPPDYKRIVYDAKHGQIFVAWHTLDRVDVLSASDYHLIRSIRVPSPSSVDISPDNTTLAVACRSAHILFFDTATLAKTNDIVFSNSALGVSSFVYAGNGNGIVRAEKGLSTGGGIAAYWDHLQNAFINQSYVTYQSFGSYNLQGPIARSGDYSRIMIGDYTSGGSIQIIDGNTGQVLNQTSYFSNYIFSVAINKDASRYAACAQAPGAGQYLLVLDASLNLIYQDSNGCLGIAFSSDGNSLYRETTINNQKVTQAINMSDFSVHNTTNNLAPTSNPYPVRWEDADGSGMVYGENSYSLNGSAFFAVDTTTSATPPPPSLDDPVRIVRVIDNIGSPQGGDSIRLLCSGLDTVTANPVSVTIGGNSVTDLSVILPTNLYVDSPALPNMRIVLAKTPPGSPGLEDVTLSAGGATDTASKAFQYVRSTKSFPFASPPNFLLYDPFRKLLYAAHKDQVEVIDPIARQVLAPLVPASGKLANSQFAGISLSPDGKRLYICDTGADLIHILNLDSPGMGISINPTAAVGTGPIVPGRVFETASGRVIGTDVSNLLNHISGPAPPLFIIDPGSSSGALMKDSQGNNVGGYAWNSTNSGAHVFISRDGNGLIWSQVGLWNDAESQYSGATDFLALRNQTQWIVEASANEDGTAVAAGGSTPGIQDWFPEIVDFNLNSMGLIESRFDVPPPTGTPSFFLDSSGALLYKAGVVTSTGPSPFGGSVEIDDVHQYQAVATLQFPEPFLTSYTPYLDHMLTMDDTGRYLFGVTQSGISMMALDTTPLSIGNLQPAFGNPAGGYPLTIRGAGFEPGTVASFDGTQVITTVLDENTLSVLAPAMPAGWHDVTVTNTDGRTYSWSGAYLVIGAQPTPAITGISPATLTAGFYNSSTVTLVGSGFANYDTVEIGGTVTDSVFVDSSHIQVAVPGTLTIQPGTIPFAVVSPFTGFSNTQILSVINPIPVIQHLGPLTIVTGSSTSGVLISGAGFVGASVIQWNGNDLSTISANAGSGLLSADVPGSLLTTSGSATVTVFNPAPGGGVSNGVSVDISPPHPLVSYPANIDFGNVIVNTSSTQTVYLSNNGTANYNLTSATLSPGPFSSQIGNCTNVPPSAFYACTLQLQVLPTTTGAVNSTLTITDNVTGSPHVIPVTANATQSQTVVPTATLISIDSVGQTISVTVTGTESVGGASVSGTAWVEYGTDKTLATYSQTSSVPFTGDNQEIRINLSGLTPSTTYAARLAVQTMGGTGRSGIKIFTTLAAAPWVSITRPAGGSDSATVTAGQTATYNLVAWDGGNGYTGTATFTCTGAPQGSTCTVTPSSLSVGLSPAPFQVIVTTTARSSVWPLLPPAETLWALGLLLIATAKTRVRRVRRFAMAALLLAMLGVALSCGGSSSSPVRPNPPVATPAGTYVLTVTGTTGGVQNGYLLFLTVN